VQKYLETLDIVAAEGAVAAEIQLEKIQWVGQLNQTENAEKCKKLCKKSFWE
jgi:hypothetical protein